MEPGHGGNHLRRVGDVVADRFDELSLLRHSVLFRLAAFPRILGRREDNGHVVGKGGVSVPKCVALPYVGARPPARCVDPLRRTADHGRFFPTSARWYVVQTKPHRETRAALALDAQGYRVFLPRFTKTVRHARKLTVASTPLFPRYLFVALDLSRDRWRNINATFGVSRVIMGEELPIPVPIGVVEALQAGCGANGHILPDTQVIPGDQVRILQGPFGDFIGKLVRIDDAGRARVLLALMGGDVAVSMHRSTFMPLRLS